MNFSRHPKCCWLIRGERKVKKLSYQPETSHAGRQWVTFNQFFQRNFRIFFLEFSMSKKFSKHVRVGFDRKLMSDQKNSYISWISWPGTLVRASFRIRRPRIFCVGDKTQKTSFGHNVTWHYPIWANYTPNWSTWFTLSVA